MDVEVTVQHAADDEPQPPPDDDDFERWVFRVAETLDRPLALTARLVSAQESQQLNRDYRGRDKPTNVLSFPFEPPPGIDWQDPYIGDLALCSQVIQQEAVEQGKGAREHWAHMVIHGTLHLLGYDHQNNDEAEAMEALEIRLLAGLHIADPYRTPGETEQS